MGGGGFAADAVNSMRANRLLRKKPKFKDVKNLVVETSGKTELEFKEVSPEELVQIKLEIRKKAREAAWRETVIFILCAIVVISSLYWLLFE